MAIRPSLSSNSLSAPENRVTLQVGGTLYAGWTSFRVTRSLEHVAGTFKLEVTERWPDEPKRRPIKTGDRCSLAIGGNKLITGYVDAVRRDYDAEHHRVTFTGRDVTGDLVDCSPWPFVDFATPMKLEEVITRYCARFKIPVRSLVDTGLPIETPIAQPGCSAFDDIADYCQSRAVMAVSDGLGSLVLTRAGLGGRVPDRIELGRNVVRGSGEWSDEERFSEVHVFGQRPGNDDIADPSWTTEGHGIGRDPNVRRYRPYVVVATTVDGDAGLQQRAEWEARHRSGRAERFSYELKGWRHAGGALWQPNTLVPVHDSFFDLDREMLIAAVEFALDEFEGSRTTLVLTDRAAFDLIPIPLKDDGLR